MPVDPRNEHKGKEAVMSPIDRRTLLQRLMVLAGATALTPAFSLEALAADTSPLLLDASHFALLNAVADTMVPVTDTPGAIAAGVPRAFDALLRTWASQDGRAALIGALKAIDSLSNREEKQPFAKLSPTKRHALLAAYDASALKAPSGTIGTPLANAPTEVDPQHGRARQEPPSAPPTAAKGGKTSFSAEPNVVNPAYAKLKELIVVLFYLSEVGITNELSYAHNPGSWDPSIPVTPQTRPQGGLSLI